MSGRVAAVAAACLATAVCAAALGAEVPEDIRDIRGPKFVQPSWLIPVLLAAGALLALSAYGAYLRGRRKSPRILSPLEVALQRLEEIRSLMEPGMARAFGAAVSDIVRHYIEARFGVTATLRTTEEFLQDLVKSPNQSLQRHRPLLSEFLQQCDLVKFAGVSPAPQLLESLRQSARAFVLASVETPDALPAA